MTDLHTHLLPCMDDGAKNEAAAAELLRMEQADGVTQIALTPHFRCGTENAESFFARREQSAQMLKQVVQVHKLSFQFKLGAEVYFSSELPYMSLAPLCLQGTPYFLLELPTSYPPAGLREIVYAIQAQGCIPILAHVERYAYLVQNPQRLYELVEAGAIIQVNAGSILHGGDAMRGICRLFRWGLVHVIASDAHSPQRRPPQLRKAFAALSRKLRPEDVAFLQDNARLIFAGESLELPEPRRPRHILGKIYL